MRSALQLRIGGVLLLAALFGGTSVASAPTGTHIGFMWPVGLTTGVLIWCPRAGRPLLAPVIGLIGFATYYAEDQSLAIGFGYALSIAVESLLVERLVRGPGGTYSLAGNTDVVRYARACGIGALVGAAGFAVTSGLADFGSPVLVAEAALATHLAGQLIVVPFFLERPTPSVTTSRRERIVRWSATLGMALAAFIPSDLPSLLFLVLPLLGWTAVRAPMQELLWQLVAVATLMNAATQNGLGPFSRVQETSPFPAEILAIPQQAFLIGCVLVSVPFAVAVRRQRESAREAATEKSRMDRVVESARGVAIMGTDAEGRIDLFNPGAVQVLGYQPEDVIGRTARMFHTDAELARKAVEFGCEPGFLSVVAALRSLPPGTATEWEFIRKDGEPRILSLIMSPVLDDDGTLTGHVATADDVTERIATTRALEKALDAERQAVMRMQEVDLAKDVFVSTVSHELRTPITNIVGYLELLRDGMYGDVSAGQIQALERVDANSRRLLGLIDDLLTLSRVEHIDETDLMTPVDLGSIVERVGQLAGPIAGTRDVTVRSILPDRPVHVLGDAVQLERLISNLVGNAVKFTGPGGRVTTSVIPNGTSCRLDVSDTGMGIPTDELPQVFNRFFRSRTAQAEAVQGSGLGLAISKSIAEAHEARLSVDSEVGVGTTFHVDFPHVVAT